MAGQTDRWLSAPLHRDTALPHWPHHTLHSTQRWIVGRQKERALDSFKRIKEAEKRVGMRRGDLQICKELNKRCEHTDSVASGFMVIEIL